MDRRRFLAYSGATLLSALAGCNDSGLDWSSLESKLTGELIRTSHQDYPTACLLHNPRFDEIKPQAIVRCSSVDDVHRALEFTCNNRVAVVPRSGGHSFGGCSTTTGVVIDTSRLNAIEINGDTVRIGAGAKLGEIYQALHARGLCLPAGTCPSVGIAGLTQGGGIGPLDRRYGLTCDSLIGAEIVTSDGVARRCDEEREPDLFWSLRGGGGGNFGIVTSLTFRTHPLREITKFAASFQFEDAPAVLSAWQDLPGKWPDSLWGQICIERVAYQPSLTVKAYSVEEGSERYWDAFVAGTGAKPMGSRQVVAPYPKAILLEQKGRHPMVASSDYFDRPLPSDGIETLLRGFENQAAGSRAIILDHMGGGIARVGANSTAFPHRQALFSAYYQLISNGADTAWPNDMRLKMRPYSTGGAYVNYIDLKIEDYQRAYYGGNYQRLCKVKARYDRQHLFKFPHGVQPG